MEKFARVRYYESWLSAWQNSDVPVNLANTTPIIKAGKRIYSLVNYIIVYNALIVNIRNLLIIHAFLLAFG